MRIFVTGAGGFVGRWLCRELEAAGHEVVASSRQPAASARVDVRDLSSLAETLAAAAPDAVVHLAAVSSSAAAAADPERAFAVTVGGTINLMEAVRRIERPVVVLVTGSSEVYGAPSAEELPLTESAQLRPGTTYALSKAGQESVALAYAARLHLPLVVTRSFNHTGPGQRRAFVVPALAERILEMREGRAVDIPVGNMHVRRDFLDVRDVARAYRLLLEALAGGRLSAGGSALNVCSGEAVSIGRIVDLLCAAADVPSMTRIDPSLVRVGEPEEIRGDAARLRAVVDWEPQRPIAETLADVWRELTRTTSSRVPE